MTSGTPARTTTRSPSRRASRVPGSLNPDTIVEKEEIKRVIVDAIKELPEKEKKVLVLYYYEDLTLKEIGEVLEVTESRVSQLHTKAVMRLRAKLTSFKRGIV